MTAGPLHPDNLANGRDRILGRGHGTAALGPSDSSDSGSDLHGAPGLATGPDIGDANMDSDSDRYGTGERGAAERDMEAAEGADIDTDHIERIPEGFEDLDEESGAGDKP